MLRLSSVQSCCNNVCRNGRVRLFIVSFKRHAHSYFIPYHIAFDLKKACLWLFYPLHPTRIHFYYTVFRTIPVLLKVYLSNGSYLCHKEKHFVFIIYLKVLDLVTECKVWLFFRMNHLYIFLLKLFSITSFF